MRLWSWVVVAAVGFSINAAIPVWAKDGVAELQEQGPNTQSNAQQTAVASIRWTTLMNGRPVLKVDSRTCEEKTKGWNKWYAICLKECEDIAADYTFYNSKSSNSPATTSLYQQELNSCINACNSKYEYYLNDLC